MTSIVSYARALSPKFRSPSIVCVYAHQRINELKLAAALAKNVKRGVQEHTVYAYVVYHGVYTAHHGSWLAAPATGFQVYPSSQVKLAESDGGRRMRLTA